MRGVSLLIYALFIAISKGLIAGTGESVLAFVIVGPAMTIKGSVTLVIIALDTGEGFDRVLYLAL